MNITCFMLLDFLPATNWMSLCSILKCLYAAHVSLEMKFIVLTLVASYIQINTLFNETLKTTET